MTAAETENTTALPTPEAPPPSDDGCWTPRRRELRAWLERNAPQLGEIYSGAVELLCIHRPPGLLRFVAHAVREIRNRLPDVIAGESKPRFEATNRLDDLSNLWKRNGPTSASMEGQALPPEDQVVEIDARLLHEFERLVVDHRASRETAFEKATRLFEAADRQSRQSDRALGPIVRHWMRTTEWATKYAHVPNDSHSQLSVEETREKFELFEIALSGLIAEFYTAVEGLDEILEEANN